MDLLDEATKGGKSGAQMGIGHISETSAVSDLIQHYKLNDEHHKILAKTSEEKMHEEKAKHPSKEDADDREEHGKMMSTAIQHHISNEYPGYKVSKIHHTNYVSVKDATNGVHNDSRVQNPSDVVMELTHPKTGDVKYHGYSLKSTQKKGGQIGFKNPTPKSMDNFGKKDKDSPGIFGTNRTGLHKAATDELFERHPEMKSVPNKSKDESKPSRKSMIENNPEIRKSVDELSKKHFSGIAKHTSDALNHHLENHPNGHNNLKKYIRDYYMNSNTSMPYAKVTASGTGKNKQVKTEDVANSHVSRLLNNPQSKMKVTSSNNYVKYHIQDPDTGKWHGIAHEQVKTSSGFGYSSARHNIHPATDLKEE